MRRISTSADELEVLEAKITLRSGQTITIPIAWSHQDIRKQFPLLGRFLSSRGVHQVSNLFALMFENALNVAAEFQENEE